jgi:uncharacterized membrane protein YphA (DoxX/SURF4 family)
MIAALHIAFTAGAAALLWWAWQELNLLRGTAFFDYRYVLLLCAGFALFSLAQALAAWLGEKLSPTETDVPHE